MASTEKTPLEAGWILERERAVAWLRLAFAIVAITVIQLNPSRIARFPALSAFTLGSFLLYSLVALYFSWTNRRGSVRVGAITTSLDVVWIALIVYSTGGTRTPFFFYYSFPVITASLRWGIRGSIPVALVGVGAYAVMRLTLAAEAGGEPIGIDTIVIRSLYLIVLACIFGYISEFEKKQNERLLALSHTAGQVAALQERRRIMYDLHDGVLQSLATLILRLESVRGRLPDSQTDLYQEIRAMENLTRNSMNDVRKFLNGNELQPLIHGTLVEKLRDELRFLQEGLGMGAILETEPEELNLPPEVEREVYYVLREGLTNITHHSHASRAEIFLRRQGSNLEGMLIDDGVGINLPTNLNTQGVGLKSMRERIEKLGGGFELKSSPGNGMKVIFSLPIWPKNKAAINS